MSSFFDSSQHLERELTPEPIAGPAAGSAALHLTLAAFLIFYGWMLGLFHHSVWGNPGAGGSIQVTLVSPLPLPATEPNKNVLATQKPSPAPAKPTPKEEHHVDEKAIPILGKPVVKPQPETAPKTQAHQPQPQQNAVPYGEQPGNVLPHQMTHVGTAGPTTVGDNSFASLYGWYVDQINRKMGETWNRYEVDPRTPRGARVYLTFTIHRDGSVSNLQLDRSSGSTTLDSSCERGVQRVDTFGNLPAAYNQSTLRVSYYCEY
jgi:periplasmic protein TonB